MHSVEISGNFTQLFLRKHARDEQNRRFEKFDFKDQITPWSYIKNWDCFRHNFASKANFCIWLHLKCSYRLIFDKVSDFLINNNLSILKPKKCYTENLKILNIVWKCKKIISEEINIWFIVVVIIKRTANIRNSRINAKTVKFTINILKN